MTTAIKSMLVANRGKIAVRAMRAAAEPGIKADESCVIGPVRRRNQQVIERARAPHLRDAGRQALFEARGHLAAP